MIWLGANTSLDTNHDIPKVLFLPQAEMEVLYYKEDADINSNQLHGLYDQQNDTSYCLKVGTGVTHGI